MASHAVRRKHSRKHLLRQVEHPQFVPKRKPQVVLIGTCRLCFEHKRLDPFRKCKDCEDKILHGTRAK